MAEMLLKRRKSSKQQLCQETIVGLAAYELGVSVDMKTLSIEVQRIRNFWINTIRCLLTWISKFLSSHKWLK